MARPLDWPARRRNSLAMVGITVTAGVPGRARLAELEEPERRDNELLVEPLAVGVCGTEREIVGGVYGSAPPGRDWLVLGHESLGRVHRGRPVATSQRVTSSSESFAALIPSRAPAAAAVSSTCAATACTGSAASRSSTATARNCSRSSLTSP